MHKSKHRTTFFSDLHQLGGMRSGKRQTLTVIVISQGSKLSNSRELTGFCLLVHRQTLTDKKKTELPSQAKGLLQTTQQDRCYQRCSEGWEVWYGVYGSGGRGKSVHTHVRHVHTTSTKQSIVPGKCLALQVTGRCVLCLWLQQLLGQLQPACRGWIIVYAMCYVAGVVVSLLQAHSSGKGKLK